MNDGYYAKAIEDANEAAYEAGKAWLEAAMASGPAYSVHSADIFGNCNPSPIDYMLDLCGNAHVRVRDGRSKFAKYLKRAYREKYNITVPIVNKLKYRQEHGLMVAMAEAAKKVLEEDYLIKGLSIWSYID